MFMTDELLFELKYSNVKYRNMFICDVFFEYLKCIDFNKSKELTIFELSKCLYHRLIDIENNIWEIKNLYSQS